MENIILEYDPKQLKTWFILGGAIRYDQNRQKATIVGVLSWFTGGVKNGTDVYARIDHVLPWVRDTINAYT